MSARKTTAAKPAPFAAPDWPATRVEMPFMAPPDDGEVWKPIPIYSGYEASSYGRIRSIRRIVIAKWGDRLVRKIYNGSLIVPWLAGSNLRYLYVALGRYGSFGVHRLVAMAFHGLPPSTSHEAAHWNGVPSDNYPRNIRWATPLENNRDMDRHGTRYTGIRPRGIKHHKAKLTDQDVKNIRSSCAGRRGELTELAALYKMDRSTISDIRNGKIWKHI